VEGTGVESPPGNLELAGVFEEEVERGGQSGSLEMNQQQAGGLSMEVFMRMMTEMEMNRERRREEAERRREERDERILTQIQTQWETMNGRVRPVADPVRSPMPALPRVGINAPLEPFISAFETQLRGCGVAEGQWKYHLIGQIDDSHRAVLADQLANEDLPMTIWLEGWVG